MKNYLNIIFYIILMSLENKVIIINSLHDKIFFYDNNLYKIVNVNTTNIYAFKYSLNKELKIDLYIMFYKWREYVEYYNFKNELGTEKIKLKLKDIIEKPYKIVDSVDISNLYFIKFDDGCNDIQIIIKDNFNESLFNTNITKLKDTYDIRTFIKTISTEEINKPVEYYQKIRAEYLHNKKYFNRKYLSADIFEMCENEIEFIDSVKYIDYVNIR